MSTKESVEIKVARLEVQVDEIKNNHLVHLAADVKEIQKAQAKTDLKIAYWSGGIGVVVILAEILIKKYA